MGVTSPLKGQTHSRPSSLSSCLISDSSKQRIILTSPSSSSSSSTPPLSSPEREEIAYEAPCNYINGRWVHDKMGPLYNGTTVVQSKTAQNCISHGRPDWVTFTGDGNRANASSRESLLCLLATASNPTLVYTNGEDNKFRRWHFASHNVTVSVYWSPFLVRGVEKSKSGPDHNELYVDVVDESVRGIGRCLSQDRALQGEKEKMVEGMDADHRFLFEVLRNRNQVLIIMNWHWYLHPAVYYDGGSVLGCHYYCPGLNHTEIGFYDAMRKAVKTALEAIIERKMGSGNGIDVFLTSFSPSHFEGEWDKAGACPKTEPYKEGEKMVEGMDADMRTIAVEEMEAATVNAKQFGGLRLEILDVTKLSLMRPDGHPGLTCIRSRSLMEFKNMYKMTAYIGVFPVLSIHGIR
ncbi:hypothetical protein GQ457_04G006840 [Hibiscus cannabinus]